MSRYEIAAFKPGHKIVVGWDHPMQTFFVQVIDRRLEDAGEDEKFVLWKGCSLREIYEVEQLAAAVRRHAHLSTDVRGFLYRDKDEGR